MSRVPDLHALLVDSAPALRSWRKVKCRSDARFVDSQWSGLWPECFWCFVFLVAQTVFQIPHFEYHQIPEPWHSWKPADPFQMPRQGRNWPPIFSSSRVPLYIYICTHVFFLGKNTKNGILLEDGWKEKLQVKSKFNSPTIHSAAMIFFVGRVSSSIITKLLLQRARPRVESCDDS